MTKGRWTIVIILVVAAVMAVSTWPLLKLRRQREILGTEALITTLERQCKDYLLDHGVYPGKVSESGWQRNPALDAWGRAIQYRYPGIRNPRGVDIWSLGPDPDDPSDDLGNWSASGSP